jgi:hypothetical protein
MKLVAMCQAFTYLDENENSFVLHVGLDAAFDGILPTRH